VKVPLSIALGCWLALAIAAAGLTADEQMRFADGIYLRGLYETAAGEYLRLLRDFPDSPHVPGALFRTGESYRQMGNQVGAERFYKRVEDEYPGAPQSARARLRRVELALGSDRVAEALALLQDLPATNVPPDVAAAATYYTGLAQHRAGNRQKAGAAWRQVLERHADSPHAAYAALDLATLHADGRTREAQVAEWFETAVAAAATASGKAEALFRWGDWAYRNGHYDVAADILQSLLVELPNEPRATDALLALGWSLFYLDRTPEALARTQELLSQAANPDTTASATYLRANLLRKTGRDLEALLDFETIVRNHPGRPEAPRAAYDIMATHFQRGDFAQALTTAPVRPAPEQEADVLWMRGESERELGRVELARGRFETLIRDFPESPSVPAALVRLGEMARAEGRMADAAEWFGRVAAEHPGHPAAAEALGAAALARLRAGDSSGALADWDSLLALQPGPDIQAEARFQQSLALLELGRRDEAMASLDTLLRDHPNAPQAARAQYWRGVMFAEREQWEQAESALRDSLSTGADPQTASLARLRLVVALQQQGRLDEAADQVVPLLEVPELVAGHPALVEWSARRRFEQKQFAAARDAALALARHAPDPSWRQIGWHWAGLSHLGLGDEPAAMDAFEQAVLQSATTREGVESQLQLAAFDLRSGRHQSSADRFTAAAEFATDDDLLDLRVRAFFGLGESAEAANELERAARHFLSVAVLFDDPEWTPRSLHRAGELWGRVGRHEEQAAAWQELTERFPESEEARQMERPAP